MKQQKYVSGSVLTIGHVTLNESHFPPRQWDSSAVPGSVTGHGIKLFVIHDKRVCRQSFGSPIRVVVDAA